MALMTAAACTPGPVPSGLSYAEVDNSAQWTTQQGAYFDTLEAVNGFVFQYANESLLSYAGIFFYWEGTSEISPPNVQDPTEPWPDPRDEANRQFYFDNAAVNRDTAQFGVFFVGHTAANNIVPGTCPDSMVGGVTLPNLPNSVSQNRSERASWIFLTDVAAGGSACNVPSRGNLLMSVFGHEVGHLRAQLTENDPVAYPYYQTYHQGSVPSRRFDAMATHVSAYSLSLYPRPVFDAIDTIPHPNDPTSCQGNLFNSRSVQ